MTFFRVPVQRTNTRPFAASGLLLLLLLPALGTGCSHGGAKSHINAPEAAARAIADYDSDHDGFLDTKELERAPGLKSAMTLFDKDKDGRLSLTEIEEGLTAIEQGQVGLALATCKFTLDKKPLVGASVTVEPEPFLEPYIKRAQGITNESGGVSLQIEGEATPGCNVGLYRVLVSKMVDGRETIPTRYNSQTKLGLGVGSGLAPRGSGLYLFHLTSP